ncbi:MAG: hypothetical protein COY49_12370 [Comamonadaceae bacterium CG_4_10_14_0_8_um_filter_57_29]|nr:MAG: hypothetical protein COY49_12370 [Comamonadaceae bacterium CG_4_10_14_0_8_um_filter_57_29]
MSQAFIGHPKVLCQEAERVTTPRRFKNQGSQQGLFIAHHWWWVVAFDFPCFFCHTYFLLNGSTCCLFA